MGVGQIVLLKPLHMIVRHCDVVPAGLRGKLRMGSYLLCATFGDCVLAAKLLLCDPVLVCCYCFSLHCHLLI